MVNDICTLIPSPRRGVAHSTHDGHDPSEHAGWPISDSTDCQGCDVVDDLARLAVMKVKFEDKVRSIKAFVEKEKKNRSPN